MALQSETSGQAFFVYAILAVLAIAGVWRGVIYLHGVRTMS
jgi:hypothetical protein